ncbi:hypothetical protein DFH11DRAFT_1214058 [Phellopilus nigrolimitatus]|nr:hypothetical protein DFH11DRAFT_1214058 [Phellopilus nigrolimitatus]
MSPRRSLPPPIRDPASGKTYVAIPAPPFIFNQDVINSNSMSKSKSKQSQILNSAPGYVYVERMTAAWPKRAFTAERSDLPEEKPSIGKWTGKHCSSGPPPGHVPWSGHIPPTSPISSDCSLIHTTFAISMQDASSDTPMDTCDSTSTFEIPTFNSGETLLDGSFPSTCSSAWSAGLCAPPISAANSQRPFSSPATCQPHSSTKVPNKRRYTTCLPDLPSRREALVFERRLALEKIEKVKLSNVNASDMKSDCRDRQALSQINELDTFFSDGLKKMDSKMQHLGEEKGRLETPSLVVSTSTAVLPVSLESSTDLLNVTPPLAIRRGKNIPLALKVDNTHSANVLDYPDVLTPFRCSPDPVSESFPNAPKYPTLVLDPTLTAEQMISSLRAQVESFLPRRPSVTTIFADQCDEAEKWLEEELAQSLSEDECSMDSARRLSEPESESNTSESTLPLPPANSPADSPCLKKRVLQTTPIRKGPLQVGGVQLASANLRSWNTKPSVLRSSASPRKSILSDGTSTTGGGKKVRFSVLPPLTIPDKIIDKKQEKSSRPVTTDGTQLPKRKPAPSVDFIKSPIMKGPLSSTPMRSLPSTPLKSTPLKSTSLKSTSLKSTPLKSTPLKSTPLKPAPFKPTSVKSTPLRSTPLKSTPLKSTPLKSKPLKPTRQPPASPRPSSLIPPPVPEKSTGRAQSLSTGSALADTPLRNEFALRRRASEATVLSPLATSFAANIEADTNAPSSAHASAKPDLNSKLMRPLSLGAKENRTLKVAGITITKRRSYDGLNKENHRDSKLADLVAKDAATQKKGIRTPFQSMLSRLRG